ncbi:hypothetical protein LMG7143_04442 [Ralstonia thomasii]|uniref:type 4b pilus protein PilO2 n=1 Tax=Ralstonia thomasii TaxID=3058596 RepID=UPI0028F676B2|nr:type 4b pilus protein PilO2 [Ralstonia sp. LMG 18095]CAJ0718543.1 hypothetical protein LMG7143_04442 [Ralstonia sp. LMG 18095]
MAELLTLPGVNEAFAIGLSWWHEGQYKGPRPSLQVLRKRARDLKEQWGVVRKTGADTFQTGVCTSIIGTKSAKTVRPLAAVVADAHPQPWNGLYQIDANRYWYIAVRDANSIINEGDLVGTREQLARVRERHRELGEWTEYDGTLEDLTRIVRATPKLPDALRDLNSSSWKPKAAGAAVGVLIVAGAGGGWIWHKQKLEADRLAMLARQQAELAAQNAQRDAQAKIPPWTQQPISAEVFDACAQAWHNQDLARKGWGLTTWRCKAQMRAITVEIFWSRQGGLAIDAPGTLAPDGQGSNLSMSIPTAFSTPDAEVLSNDVAHRVTWTLAQAHGMTLQLRPTPAPEPMPGSSSAKKDAPPDPWLSAPAEFTLPFAPWEGLSEPFSTVPALRISEVAYDAKKGQWNANGTLYSLRGGPVAAGAPVGHPIPPAAAASAPQGSRHEPV